MAAIGPSFGSEILASGLGGAPISWGADGVIQGRELLSPAQAAILDGVIAAHDAAKPAPVEPDIATRKQARAAIQAATTIAQVKAALATYFASLDRASN